MDQFVARHGGDRGNQDWPEAGGGVFLESVAGDGTREFTRAVRQKKRVDVDAL